MTRVKKRKKQREQEQSKRFRLLFGGGLMAVAVAIMGFLVLQGGSQSEPVVGEDGRLVWQTMNLRDARTGEAFTLADFDDRDVVVKMMSPF